MECVESVQATKTVSNESSWKINLGAEKKGRHSSKLKRAVKIDEYFETENADADICCVQRCYMFHLRLVVKKYFGWEPQGAGVSNEAVF